MVSCARLQRAVTGTPARPPLGTDWKKSERYWRIAGAILLST